MESDFSCRDRLTHADEKISARIQGGIEFPDKFFSDLRRKVDHHISAEDQIKIAEIQWKFLHQVQL
ncbi:hypothetical protein SDC9_208122 [bioreactor metagenome]|uniref:Uncharacterized protein n=1 Tax=bioreactor metagenome TaxID=1076179 RepID=A0A645JJ75_9ZZZZ